MAVDTQVGHQGIPKDFREGCGAKPLDSERDPWAHRSEGMRCRSCLWFVKKAADPHEPMRHNPVGRCRRHAPTMSGYPVVFSDDWCGDHKLDENKAR
jgi:hypothetical protein